MMAAAAAAAASGSLKLSHELGIRKNHGRSKNMGRVRLRLSSLSSSSSTALSFQGSSYRDGGLSLHIPNNIHRPISIIVTSRRDVFMCRSFLPSQANAISILKTAASTLSRPYNAFGGSPLVQKLIPAVSIIVFTVWGLGPLMRYSWNLFLRRSDSWKKSRTHYVMTSYLQPLLLWTATTLICRAFDPIVLPSEASEAVKRRLLFFVRSLSTVLASAYTLSSMIQQAQKFFMETTDSNNTRNMGFQFAGKALYTAVWVAAFSLFMELLGFSTQKWLTAGGLGTVLLTLAGREIFTNFLSSAMIQTARPFVVNEWIQTKIEGYEVSGTVEHVGWWSPTIIRGEDREAVHIPNHKFTVNVVRNLTQKTHWRIKTHLAISHLDVNKINIIVADMRKVLAKNPQVEQQKLHRRVFLENINPENQALLILISCFVKTSHLEEYLCVKETILLDLLRVISHHRARLATPIRTIQKIYRDPDMEDIPFSDTIYANPRATNNRPLLLIEPSYKINGEDNKSKAQARSARKNEEQDNKVTTAPTSDTKVDIKVEEKSSESKADSKVVSTSSEAAETSTSDSKIDIKIATTSVSDSKVDVKVPSKSTSESKSSIPDSSAQNNSDKKQPKKGSAGEVRQKSSKTESVSAATVASTSHKSQLEGLDSGGRNSKLGAASEKTSVNLSEPASVKAEATHPATFQAKQEGEKVPVTPSPTARPALEENIVLGVALEGSKRTLPIEEGMTPSSTTEEAKELAACHNRNGSSTVGKDKKTDGSFPGVPGTVSTDQRDAER